MEWFIFSVLGFVAGFGTCYVWKVVGLKTSIADAKTFVATTKTEEVKASAAIDVLKKL